MKEFQPCEKHLGLGVYCGGYSPFVDKIVHCSICNQKLKDGVYTK